MHNGTCDEDPYYFNIVCSCCGTEITNGVNGCMLMDICFVCSKGNYPSKYTKIVSNVGNVSSEAGDYYESRCIDRGE